MGMYKACIIEEDPLIRNVLTSVLRKNDFEVQKFCNFNARCPDFANTCRLSCKRSGPCYNMSILFNCERDPTGMEFLKFVDRYQCPCIHSFKVLYTCEEVKEKHIESLDNLHVQFVEKDNPVFDLLPMIEKYKRWYASVNNSSLSTPDSPLPH